MFQVVGVQLVFWFFFWACDLSSPHRDTCTTWWSFAAGRAASWTTLAVFQGRGSLGNVGIETEDVMLSVSKVRRDFALFGRDGWMELETGFEGVNIVGSDQVGR